MSSTGFSKGLTLKCTSLCACSNEETATLVSIMQLVKNNTLIAYGTIVRPGNRTSGYLLEESIHFLQIMLAMFGWQIHFWLTLKFMH